MKAYPELIHYPYLTRIGPATYWVTMIDTGTWCAIVAPFTEEVATTAMLAIPGMSEQGVWRLVWKDRCYYRRRMSSSEASARSRA